jgi:hypothetical protein
MNNPLIELKHSIKTHLMVMAGPTPQLAVFLLKTLDWFDEPPVGQSGRDQEMTNLAFTIVEAIGLFVHASVDKRNEQAKQNQQTFPPRITQASDNILVVVGKCRGLDDKIAAKNAVLGAISASLKELALFTKSKYPAITDSQMHEL